MLRLCSKIVISLLKKYPLEKLWGPFQVNQSRYLPAQQAGKLQFHELTLTM